MKPFAARNGTIATDEMIWHCEETDEMILTMGVSAGRLVLEVVPTRPGTPLDQALALERLPAAARAALAERVARSFAEGAMDAGRTLDLLAQIESCEPSELVG
jgi:hypothetical protein